MKPKYNTMAVLTAFVMAALLSTSCDEATRKKISSDVNQELNKDEGIAISAVLSKLADPLERIRTNKGKDKATVLKNHEAALDDIQAIDVSDCPKDFRDAWYEFKTASQDFELALGRIPKTDAEQFAYAFQKGTEGKLDGGANELIEAVKRGEAKYKTCLSEVRAIAKQYGAE